MQNRTEPASAHEVKCGLVDVEKGTVDIKENRIVSHRVANRFTDTRFLCR
jgi:hypothetical protein